MPPDAFHDQLAALANEYDVVYAENLRLKSELHSWSKSHQRQEEEDYMEMAVPSRVFQQEATHGVLLSTIPGSPHAAMAGSLQDSLSAAVPVPNCVVPESPPEGNSPLLAHTPRKTPSPSLSGDEDEVDGTPVSLAFRLHMNRRMSNEQARRKSATNITHSIKPPDTTTSTKSSRTDDEKEGSEKEEKEGSEKPSEPEKPSESSKSERKSGQLLPVSEPSSRRGSAASDTHGNNSAPIQSLRFSSGPMPEQSKRRGSFQDLLPKRRGSVDSSMSQASRRSSERSEGMEFAATSSHNSNRSMRSMGKRHSQTSNQSMGSYESVGSVLSVYNRKATPMFANLEAMKARVRAQLAVGAYNVTDFYKEEGVCQAIARHPVFDTVSLAVIGVNAIWMAIDTDYNHQELLADAHPVFQVAEHFFCSFFLAEVVIRFCAFEYKLNCLGDRWFLFDSVLVFIMILDTWVINLAVSVISQRGDSSAAETLGNTSILRMARLLRLTRMARMARLLRAMPELLVLLKGMAAAARSVFFTLVLLAALLYVFAILFTQLLAKEPIGDLYFHSVGKSFMTLWLYGTLLDEITVLVADMEVENAPWYCLIILNIFILLAALTVMNMLVGVLCEVVSGVASMEKEEASLNMVKVKVERIFESMEKEHDDEGAWSMISKDEFEKLVEHPDAVKAIQDLGVDVERMIDMADTLFACEESGEFKKLTFAQFMEAVVQMRGQNAATVKDLVNLQKKLNGAMSKLQTDLLISIERLTENQRREGERRMSVSAGGGGGGGGSAGRRFSQSKTLGSIGVDPNWLEELNRRTSGAAESRRGSTSRRPSCQVEPA